MRTLAGIAGMLAALAAVAPSAHAQSKETLARVNHLFDSAGLAAQLKSLPAQFEQGVLQNRGKLPDELLAALVEAGKQAYAAPALRSEIVAAIAHTLPEADMKQALAWLDGPAGKRMTRAEERAASSMTPPALQAYFEREKTKPSGPARAELISELIVATNSVEIGATFMEAMALGVAAGMDATQPAEKQIGIAALRERLRAAMPRDQLRANLSASLPAMYGFTYRNISDADLSAYVEFNGTPPGKRYNQSVMTALTEAVTRASLRIGEMVKTAPEKKKI